MMFIVDWKRAFRWRLTIQWLFFGWCLFIGVQFGLFVRHFESHGQAGYYSRPPGVEGFLPIGALVSLKSFVLSGHFDRIHPAALILFLTILAVSLLAKKSFCSFLCPVGNISEGTWKLGQRMFGGNFRIWTWLDYLLQAIKYCLLAFFIKLIIIDMPLMAIKSFLSSPYWAIADVKMLDFFTNMSRTSLFIILGIFLLSFVYRNFWCRYLCPYGALLGLLSMFSAFKVVRNRASCTGCGSCTRACPSLIDVQHKRQVYSPECTGCMTCMSHCPEKGVLNMGFFGKPVSALTFLSFVILVFAGGVLFGMLNDYWQTGLTYEDYQRLIPAARHLVF